MARKLSKSEVDLIVKNFANAASKKYAGHAYAGHAFTAGYLQSLVCSLLMHLPAKEQKAQIHILLSSSVWE